MATEVMLRVSHLTKEYRVGGFLGRPRILRAVTDVSFEVFQGETFAIVGESGSGKSTVARCILRLIEPTSGRILYRGEDITQFSPKRMWELRRRLQIVFQDPFSSLNPRMRVESIVREPLDNYGIGSSSDRRARVREVLRQVGLGPEHMNLFPHQLSGGQRQRVAIAAALVLQPELIVLDEAVSALDVSVQAQILNLLARLQQEYRLTLIFISHDLSVVAHFADWVAVMYLGRIVEVAPAREVFSRPLHPYTQALLSAVPRPVAPADNTEPVVPMQELDRTEPVLGCPFYPRCPVALEICRTELPPLREVGQAPGDESTTSGPHRVACHQVGGHDGTTGFIEQPGQQAQGVLSGR